MTREDSTKPIELEGPHRPVEDGLGAMQPTWTSSWRTRLISPLKDRPEANGRPVANRNGVSTSGLQKFDVPDRRPRRLPATTFGNRGLLPIYQWEGEVEAVNGEGFTARLMPFENGIPVREKTEFTDFYFDDLADPSDIELVVPGAVFYWTLGRGKNEAGTVTNTSLVRFRRLPSPGVYQQNRAKAEAQELVKSFGARRSN